MEAKDLHVRSLSVHEHDLPGHTAADYEVTVADGLTIDLSVFHSKASDRKGEGTVLLPAARTAAEKGRFEGSDAAGKLLFVLDNQFSWAKSKRVRLAVSHAPLRPSTPASAAASPTAVAPVPASPAQHQQEAEAEEELVDAATGEPLLSLTDKLDGLVEDEAALALGSGVAVAAVGEVAAVAAVSSDSAEQAALRRSQALLASLDAMSAEAAEHLPSDACTIAQLRDWAGALRKLSRRYTLAFVGGFNVGKTTVINTLLRRRRADAGPLLPVRAHSQSSTPLPQLDLLFLLRDCLCLQARMMPTTSVNVFIRHVSPSSPPPAESDGDPDPEQQLSYLRVDGSADPAHSSTSGGRRALTEEEFLSSS